MTAMFGSKCMVASVGLPARMRMRLEIQLPTAPIGYVGIELGRGEVGVSEHLLDRTQVGAALEQVCRERVAQKVGMHALRLEAGLRRQSPQDQEGAGARQSAPPRVEEELRAVA